MLKTVQFIHPDDSKIQVTKDWKQPKNKHQLKSFLGFVNFFHRHIDHYATKAAPLTDLLPGNKPDKLRRTEKQQNAFDNLKAALMAKPILRPPNPKKRVYLVHRWELNRGVSDTCANW